ncbi:hypothetical protein [Leptotrichia trevisanii]|uniref:hypothetical protein n=1 Tax=Leptotrichia trevisanii TaxID=109328 RepID=UPI000410166B|nr:hypothetical protein [Leptotrichia trevisanii]
MATKSFKKDLIFTNEAANNFFKIMDKKTTKKNLTSNVKEIQSSKRIKEILK